MKRIFDEYSTKFHSITIREQYLILLTGLIGIVFILFTLLVDGKLIQTERLEKQVRQLQSNQKSAQTTIQILEQSLAQDPNDAINKQISQYEQRLTAVDNELLLLTSDLINPIQMRYALIELLQTQKAVSLLSFEVLPAQSMNLASQNANDSEGNEASEQPLTLYKHGIKLTLKGGYFALRDYLTQLEQLEWRFFWQEFDYQLTQYPQSELTIEMYSLSTKEEFIGV